MASFDPSIISQIPDMAGNPLEAQGKAFKLADLMTQEQSNKLLLGEQKKQVEDRRKAEDILKNFKGDIGTAEGNTQLAQLYQKAGLSGQAKEAQMLGGEMHLRQLQEEKLQNEALQFSVDFVGPRAQMALDRLDAGDMAGAHQVYGRAIQELPPKYQGKFPPTLPNDPQQARQLLTQAVGISGKAQTMLNEKAQRANLADEARHRKVEESQRQQQINLQRANQPQSPSDFTDQEVMAVAGKLKSAGIPISGGMSGKAVRSNTLPYIAAYPRQPGESIQDYGARVAQAVRADQAGGKFVSAAATKVAAQATAVAKAENALVIQGGFLDQLQPYVDKVDFSKVKKLGQVEKWTKEQMTDPALLGYHDRIIDIRSQLSQALSRGGQVTDAVRDEARDYVPDIITKESYPEVRKAVDQAVRTEKRAIEREKGEMGIGGTQPLETAPGVTPPAAGGGGNVVNWADLK